MRLQHHNPNAYGFHSDLIMMAEGYDAEWWTIYQKVRVSPAKILLDLG